MYFRCVFCREVLTVVFVGSSVRPPPPHCGLSLGTSSLQGVSSSIAYSFRPGSRILILVLWKYLTSTLVLVCVGVGRGGGICVGFSVCGGACVHVRDMRIE